MTSNEHIMNVIFKALNGCKSRITDAPVLPNVFDTYEGSENTTIIQFNPEPFGCYMSWRDFKYNDENQKESDKQLKKWVKLLDKWLIRYEAFNEIEHLLNGIEGSAEYYYK